MSLATIRWDVDIIALSSIVHLEDHGSGGTDTFGLFRRETIFSAAGEPIQVPVISGGSFRGVLRRIGESLTAAALDYEDIGLPVPAAHLLTNGGRLAKSARPITDEDERHLKALVPQVAVFGGAASGRIMSGLLAVGKVLPEIDELAHLLPRPPRGPTPPAVLGTAEESFTHLGDHRATPGRADYIDLDETGSASNPLGRFGVETLPAGSRLQSWVHLSNATATEVAFLTGVLNTFATDGHLGGRTAAGHGRIRATLTPHVLRGDLAPTVDWHNAVRKHRQLALDALTALT